MITLNDQHRGYSLDDDVLCSIPESPYAVSFAGLRDDFSLSDIGLRKLLGRLSRWWCIEIGRVRDLDQLPSISIAAYDGEWERVRAHTRTYWRHVNYMFTLDDPAVQDIALAVLQERARREASRGKG